ncbi:MAG: amino acid racemase [Cyclobacteriaceae bacterium]
MIGIVGGIGPYSGIDLLRKVFDNTLACSDQEHLDAVLISASSKIQDRTEYIMGRITKNPAYAIAEVIHKLHIAGAVVAGIPCNTAHSPKIFSVIESELKKSKYGIVVLNMIEETVSYLHANHSGVTKVGVLSTTGTYKSKIYNEALQSKGYEAIVPSLEMQEDLIHPAIYHPDYGIKSKSNPIHPQARRNLMEGFSFCKQQGAQAVILGCTEIPLAISEDEIDGMIIIDPTAVLARALIQFVDSNKLKPNKHGVLEK